MPSNYTPIPAQELRARYWMLSHISDAKKIGIAIFFIIDCILGLVVLWFIVNLYGVQLLSYQRALRAMSLPFMTTSASSRLVESLHVVETGGVASGAGRSDLYALIQNPNADFMARFTYSFGDGDATRLFEGFIYPGQQKYLVEIGSPLLSENVPPVRLATIHWTRISKKGLEEIKARTALITKDFQFIPNDSAIPFSRLVFTVENPTGYGFAHVALPIVLRYGGRVVAINYTIIDGLMSAESRKSDVRWFTPTGPVDGYAVDPHIDIFSSETFLTPEGEPAPAVLNE
ncbi:MAG: hypothetical protein AAB870_00320 [Patescibacteria group bacterium]